MTIRAFCKQRGIGDHSFYSWRKRLQSNKPVQFALLKTVVSSGSPIELFLPGGERLCLPTGVDVATLRSVLQALRSRFTCRPACACIYVLARATCAGALTACMRWCAIISS